MKIIYVYYVCFIKFMYVCKYWNRAQKKYEESRCWHTAHVCIVHWYGLVDLNQLINITQECVSVCILVDVSRCPGVSRAGHQTNINLLWSKFIKVSIRMPAKNVLATIARNSSLTLHTFRYNHNQLLITTFTMHTSHTSS